MGNGAADDRDEREFVWDQHAPVDGEPAARKKPKGGSSSALGAAMLALGEILEPDKTNVVVEEASDDDHDDNLIELDFGDLPPLS